MAISSNQCQGGAIPKEYLIVIRRYPTLFSLALAATSLTACAGGTEPAAISGLPPVEVAAFVETVPVGTANADAADDPAIWRNDVNPENSLIVATDKKAGLYVYGLDGKIRSFTVAGQVNNVDLFGDIVVASDRNDRRLAHLALFRLDPATAKLSSLGRVAVGSGEAYGVCISPSQSAPQTLTVDIVMKDGRVVTGHLTPPPSGKPTFTPLASYKITSQSEGCVYDGDTKLVGEETAGIWQFPPRAEPRLVAPVDNQQLVADVEGLATIRHGDTNYLIASSQGDNAYAVYRLPDVSYVGRFRIADGPHIDGTSETDGIEAMEGDFGPDFPEGLFIAQDGNNLPEAQNFKLVSWKAIREALGIE